MVLFDRTCRDPDAVYLHPQRQAVTYRIFRLLDEQKKSLVDFLTANSRTATPSPFPVLPDQNNLRRVDPEDPIWLTGVYRDPWERKELPPDGPDSRARDVMDVKNWPTVAEWMESKRRWFERRERDLIALREMDSDEPLDELP